MKKIKLYPATKVAEDLGQKNIRAEIRMDKFINGKYLSNAPRKIPIWRKIAEVSSINQLIFASFLDKSLPCMDKNGLPLPIPTMPSEFNQLHVIESDVNNLLFNHGYRVTWKPKSTRTKRKNLTKINWKMRIQVEATTLCQRLYANNANPSRTDLADSMATLCKKNNIKTSTGVFPSRGYIRAHVLGSKYWNFPPKP